MFPKKLNAEQKMQAVNEAYAVLSDTEKRAAYDQLGQGRSYQAGSDFQPPPDWDAGFEFSGRGTNGAQGANFSDFFSELFGKQMSTGSRQTHHRMRGQDHHAKIMLDLDDTYKGTSRSLTLHMPKLDKAALVQEEKQRAICFLKCILNHTIVTELKKRTSTSWRRNSPLIHAKAWELKPCLMKSMASH